MINTYRLASKSGLEEFCLMINIVSISESDMATSENSPTVGLDLYNEVIDSLTILWCNPIYSNNSPVRWINKLFLGNSELCRPPITARSHSWLEVWAQLVDQDWEEGWVEIPHLCWPWQVVLGRTWSTWVQHVGRANQGDHHARPGGGRLQILPCPLPKVGLSFTTNELSVLPNNV